MTKTTKNILIATLVFIATSVAMFFLTKIESVSEWVTRYIYFPYAKVFGPIYSNLGFAVFEVSAFLFVLALIILISFSIYYFVHKNSEKGLALISISALLISMISFLYVSLGSSMYNRKPLDIKEEQSLLTYDEVKDVYSKYFADFEYVASMQRLDDDGSSVCPYTEKELIEKIKKEYERLDSDYFLLYTANPKQIASSYIMNAFSISGITFTPSIEPGYNYQMFTFEKCATIMHELAHTKGVMRESDANEVAYYLLLTSDDVYLKYVGYLYTYPYMVRAIRLINDSEEIYIPYIAYIDREKAASYWEEKGVMEKLGEWINSLYLKSNSQDGIDSYTSKENYQKEEIIDEEGQEKIIYTVKSFSHIQNMIFALYKN